MTGRNEQARERLYEAMMEADLAHTHEGFDKQWVHDSACCYEAMFDALLAHPDDLRQALGGEQVGWYDEESRTFYKSPAPRRNIVWRFPRVPASQEENR